MRIDFHRADFGALAALWNEFYPERYRIDEEVLKANTVGCPVFDWGASQIQVLDDQILGFVVVKRCSTPTLYKGQDIDQAHLSAIVYRDGDTAVDLMASVKGILRNRGVNRIVFGGDNRHFFPGAPTDFRNLSDFLMIEGFVDGQEVHDLERDLSDYEPIAGASADVELRPVGQHDLFALQQFLEREFPNRWCYDTLRKVEGEGTTETVFGAFKGEACVGFALVQDFHAKIPIGGGVWRNDLGEQWGSLGPIGVANELRGQGIGDALLSASLMHLKKRGVRRCIIDWTTLIDFYQRHGFEVARTYKSSHLPLGN